MSLSDNKDFLKLRDFLLNCEKQKSKSNLFSSKDFVLKGGISANDSTDGVATLPGKEGTEVFTLKVDALLDSEGLGGKSRNH